MSIITRPSASIRNLLLFNCNINHLVVSHKLHLQLACGALAASATRSAPRREEIHL